jgi:hypothetical protein
MGQVIADDGCRLSLDEILRTTGDFLDGSRIHLGTSSTLTIDTTTTLATLRAQEATFPGYAPVALSHANWPASTVSAHQASSQYTTPPTFTGTGGSPQSVYNCWIEDSSAAYLVFAGNLTGAPYVIQNAGDSLALYLTGLLKSQ